MKTISRAQIHRYGEYAAIYLQNGETVYLTEKQAREIAKALVEIARSIKKEEFAHSRVGTFRLDEKRGYWTRPASEAAERA